MSFEILKISSLFVLLIVFGEYSKVLGGLLWAFFTIFLRIPYFGRLYHFLFFNKIKISVLFKIATWVISASGILMGLLIYYLIFGISNSYIENLSILISSSVVVLNFLYRTWYLEILDYEDVFNYGKGAIRKILGNDAAAIMESDTAIKSKLIFANFVDTEIPRFLRYLVCIGLFYYTSSQLGLINLKREFIASPSLFECIKYAFSFIPIEKVDQNNVAFEGLIWDSINVFFGVVVFLWSIVFFNVALSQVSNVIQQIEKSETDKNINTKFVELDNLLENVFNHFHNILGNILKKVQNIEDQIPEKKSTKSRKK